MGFLVVSLTPLDPTMLSSFSTGFTELSLVVGTVGFCICFCQFLDEVSLMTVELSINL